MRRNIPNRASSRPDFDTYHPQVRYRDVTHYFFRRFAVKIIMAGHLVAARDGKFSIWQGKSFSDRIRQAIPNENRARFDLYRRYPVVFTETEDDAHAFMKALHEDGLGYLLHEVCRAPSKASCDEMAKDSRARIRGSLFHGRFRWKVFMRARGPFMSHHPVDEWFATTFADDSSGCRAMLTRSWPRQVFLSVVEDVVLLKLAFTDQVASIEYVILSSEILSSAFEACEAPD